MEPVTEQLDVGCPVVYGYLRISVPNSARRAALTTVLRGYCDRHELVLAGVFTDTCDDSAPGFAGLIDAIRTTGGYGVVVPSPAHLGSGRYAAQRSAEITGSGRRLMLIRGALVDVIARRAR